MVPVEGVGLRLELLYAGHGLAVALAGGERPVEHLDLSPQQGVSDLVAFGVPGTDLTEGVGVGEDLIVLHPGAHQLLAGLLAAGGGQLPPRLGDGPLRRGGALPVAGHELFYLPGFQLQGL